VKSFIKSWLTTGLWIGYVYLACLLIVSFVRIVISAVTDFVAWSNLFRLRSAIARERGFVAYRAWEPFENQARQYSPGTVGRDICLVRK
jgi:hypothetical protein